MIERCEYLAHVQFAFVGRPVIGTFYAVGDGDRELGTGAVLRIDFFRQVYTHVGVVFVTESPDGTTNRTSRSCIRAATATTKSLVDKHPRAGITLEAKPISEVCSAGLFFDAFLAGFEFCQPGVHSRRRTYCHSRRGGLQGRSG